MPSGILGEYGNSFLFSINSYQLTSLNQACCWISLKSYWNPNLAELSYYKSFDIKSLHSKDIVVPLGKWSSPLLIIYIATY